jgi:phosphate transport system substrate-binding protein
MYKTQDKPATAKEVLNYFDWSYKNGGKMAEELDYVPMPANVVAAIRKTWQESIKDDSGKSVYTQ